MQTNNIKKDKDGHIIVAENVPLVFQGVIKVEESIDEETEEAEEEKEEDE